jgi:hypothetical protein
MMYAAPTLSKWKKIRRMAVVLIVASSLLATATAVLLVMRPSWLLAICLFVQIAVFVVQFRILKVTRQYVQ